MASLVSTFGVKNRPSDVIDKWKRGRRAVFTGETIATPLGPRKLYRKVHQLTAYLEEDAVTECGQPIPEQME